MINAYVAAGFTNPPYNLTEALPDEIMPSTVMSFPAVLYNSTTELAIGANARINTSTKKVLLQGSPDGTADYKYAYANLVYYV